MKQLKAKFKLASTTDYGSNNKEAKLIPVVGDSEENKTFSTWTPAGELRLWVTNPDAIDFFEHGFEYVATISKVAIS